MTYPAIARFTGPALASHFNKFIGREVSAVEEQVAYTINGEDLFFPEARAADKSEPVYAEIRAAATAQGIRDVHFIFSQADVNETYEDSRINAYIRKTRDGKFRIAAFSAG